MGFLHLVPNGSVPEWKNEAEIQQLKQQLADIRRDKDAHVQQLQQELADVRLQNDAEIQQLQQQLADVRKEKDAHILQLQQQMADVRKDKAALNHQIELLTVDVRFHEAQIMGFQQCLSKLRRENEHLLEVSNNLTHKICRYMFSSYSSALSGIFHIAANGKATLCIMCGWTSNGAMFSPYLHYSCPK